MSKVPTKLTPEEIKLRGSLLAKNKDLLKLHKDLVFSNILTEEEFWEDRRGILRAQEMILNQKKGITSSLVSDEIKPVSGNSDIKYVLTPTIIQTIFDQHPILKKAFNDLVQSEKKTLTEREFWLEYFKSNFFNESKTTTTTSSATTTTGSSHLDPYYQETCTSTTSSIDSNIKISGQFDISRSIEDHVSDYLRYEREAEANRTAWNSLRQFNKHSLRVLQSLKSDNQNIVNINPFEFIEISDLQQVQTPEMVTLNVQESQLFANNLIKTENRNVKESDLKKFLKEYEKNNFDSNNFKLNYSQSKNFISNLLSKNNFKQDSSKLNSSNISLSDDKIQLMSSSIELLRHFWKSALVTGKITPERSEKLTRIISVLKKMEGKIILFNDNGFNNLMETIQKAKFKYSELIN